MKKNLFFMAAASIAMVSCSSEDVVEINNGNAIDFRVAMSRSTETTTANLQEFNVTALNGDQNYFTNVLFSKAADGSFKSEKQYLWPGSDELAFYAYSPANLTGVTINSTKQIVEAFSPAANILDQIDFITAYKTGTKEYETSGVPLVFKHTLSQVQINAFTESDVYNFEVKGVQIASVNNVADLNMNKGAINWTFGATPSKATYEVTYDNAITLTAESQNISGAKENGLAMLIPQQLVKWDNVNDKNNANKGTFLAVLIKITTKETGANVYPKEDGYAWACVPVDTKWEAGKRYVYTLNFTKGAGQFPPIDPEHPGDDILGGPIFFTATVEDWLPSDQSFDLGSKPGENE